MLQCKDLAQLVASDAWRQVPALRRLGIALHLVMCRHCRAYVRQLRWIARAARRVYRGVRVDAATTERVAGVVREAAQRAQSERRA